MRKRFEIYPKCRFFLKNFLCSLRFEGMNLDRKGVKWSVLMCQGQPGKISYLSPRNMTIFLHLVLFFTSPSQKFGTRNHFKITFLESTRIELSVHKVLF